MAESQVLTNRPAWVDLSSTDAAGSREFYSKLFGWQVEVNPDPQYGGYAIATAGGQDAAGIGPQMTPGAPSAWNVYIGTADADDLGRRVQAAGGNVVVPAMDVGDQGRMAVFSDPAGAIISGWQPKAMRGFASGPNAFSWAELNARGIDKAIPFYSSVFGWTPKTQTMEGAPAYTEFKEGGDSIAGGMEMNPMVPAAVPSYWLVYFGVDDIDDAFRRAIEAGGREMLAPQDYPGGRFAVIGDPQGAAFGLLQLAAG